MDKDLTTKDLNRVLGKKELLSAAIGQVVGAGIQGLNMRLVAFIIFTVVVAINIVGVKNMARMQAILVICLLAATLIFTLFGIFRVDYGAYLQPEGFFSGGVKGFLSAAALLTWAASGAQTIINFSAEAKDPTRDMPPVIIGTTVGIVVLALLFGVLREKHAHVQVSYESE